MADLRIVDAPLLSTVKGTEKIPTGGEGNFSVSVNQVADFAKLKWILATEWYVDNAVGNVQADLNLHKNNESNPHNVTKTQVGLGNVDNTADLDKPISNATQSAITTAISGKADKSYVDSQDQLKADKNTIEASLLLKADKVDLTASKILSDGNQTQQSINDFGGANWYNKSGGYALGSTVKLANGDVVKSTVANNIINPNIDMTGWLIQKTKTVVETMADLRLLKNTKEGELVFVKGYYTGNFSLTNPYEGGGDFMWAGGSTVTPVQGIIEQVTGFTTGRFLRVIESGEINVLWCGARRDGVTETHNELKIASQYSIDKGYKCYVPSSLGSYYLLGGRVDPVVKDGSVLHFKGDGLITRFKEKDGLTLTLGRFNMSFYFLCPDNARAKAIIIEDMYLDKNGVTSPAATQTDYIYEQAHGFAVASGWTNSSIDTVIIRNVTVSDKIGAGVCLAQGYINKAYIQNQHGINYKHIGGERGDFEFQSIVNDLVLESCTGRYVQCEPNLTTVPTGYTPKATFKDCTYDVTEFTAYVNSHDAQTLILDNHTAKELCLIRWAKVIAKNSTLRVRSSDNTYWEGTAKGSILEDCKTIVGINTTTNATDPLYLRSAANVPTFLKIKGGSIVPDDTINSTTTGFAINNVAFYSGAQDYLVELEDVFIDPRFERTINCYANGNYKIKNTKLAGRTGSLASVAIGGFGSNYANVELNGNDLSQLGGAYVQYTTSNTLWSVNYKGVHDFAKSGYTSSNLAQTETQAKADGYFVSDTTPTGKGILGWRLRINKPAFGAPSEFICTTTSSTTPVYQLLNQAGVKLDTTANRPTGLTAAARGLRYLDTTLAAGGKPIQYNGTAWTDSLGATV